MMIAAIRTGSELRELKRKAKERKLSMAMNSSWNRYLECIVCFHRIRAFARNFHRVNRKGHESIHSMLSFHLQLTPLQHVRSIQNAFRRWQNSVRLLAGKSGGTWKSSNESLETAAAAPNGMAEQCVESKLTTPNSKKASKNIEWPNITFTIIIICLIWMFLLFYNTCICSGSCLNVSSQCGNAATPHRPFVDQIKPDIVRSEQQSCGLIGEMMARYKSGK